MNEQQQTDQQNALFRLHRRTSLMHKEACTALLNAAVMTNDPAARQLVMNVITALKMARDHAESVLYPAEGEGI